MLQRSRDFSAVQRTRSCLEARITAKLTDPALYPEDPRAPLCLQKLINKSVQLARKLKVLEGVSRLQIKTLFLNIYGMDYGMGPRRRKSSSLFIRFE